MSNKNMLLARLYNNSGSSFQWWDEGRGIYQNLMLQTNHLQHALYDVVCQIKQLIHHHWLYPTFLLNNSSD